MELPYRGCKDGALVRGVSDVFPSSGSLESLWATWGANFMLASSRWVFGRVGVLCCTQRLYFSTKHWFQWLGLTHDENSEILKVNNTKDVNREIRVLGVLGKEKCSIGSSQPICPSRINLNLTGRWVNGNVPKVLAKIIPTYTYKKHLKRRHTRWKFTEILWFWYGASRG